MSYGRTFTRTPQKVSKSKRVIELDPSRFQFITPEAPEKKSVIEALCNEAGYNRECFETTELESKLDVELRKQVAFLKKPSITLGEELLFPAPYSLEKVLGVTEATHECYGFVSEKTIDAFTKVTTDGKIKIKIKSIVEYHTENGIIILKRDEKHKENLTPSDITLFIANEARLSNAILKYIGSFNKTSKEAFIFNPVTGRIFVIATNICTCNTGEDILYQLELEYYGRINGYKNSSTVFVELASLTQCAINDASRLGYVCKNSTTTKFDWLVRNVR